MSKALIHKLQIYTAQYSGGFAAGLNPHGKEAGASGEHSNWFLEGFQDARHRVRAELGKAETVVAHVTSKYTDEDRDVLRAFREAVSAVDTRLPPQEAFHTICRCGEKLIAAVEEGGGKVDHRELAKHVADELEARESARNSAR